MEREVLEFDVVVVGAGPAGLAAAIRLMQLGRQNDTALTICVLEKGAEVGAHILSGAILDTRALDELIPDWRERRAPVTTPVTSEQFLLMTERRAMGLPVPARLKNDGNYIISLGNLCRWLGRQAEELGVDIYPGFAASELVFDDNGSVRGVATGDMGRGRDGNPAANYQPGIELHARQLLVAEGCRGSLTRKLCERFSLRHGKSAQTYGLGLKELWEVQPEVHEPGKVVHMTGWPLDNSTYGGGFLYHLEEQQVALGLVVGLDYENPYLNPYQELQRLKTHAAVRPVLEAGRRVCYGARTLSEGGYQSVPRLTFPGGALIGDAAGFLDVPRLKGTHNAMKSGMVAAEAVFGALHSDGGAEPVSYPDMLEKTWVWKDLYRVRNIRPSFRWGRWAGMAYTAMDTWLSGWRLPWTLQHREDHRCLNKAHDSRKITYPAPDGKLTFDLPTSVYFSNTNHAEDQPVHLHLKDADIPVSVNLAEYDAPEQRYCPAGVYEIVTNEAGKDELRINAQNCLHCKACDIKDPRQNIVWTVPEGGGGPNYPNM